MGTRRIEVSGSFLVEACKATGTSPRFYVVEENALPADATFVGVTPHPTRLNSVLLIAQSDEWVGDASTPLPDTTFQVVTISRWTRRLIS